MMEKKIKILSVITISLLLVSCSRQTQPGNTEDTRSLNRDIQYELKPNQAIVPAIEKMEWAFGKNYKQWTPAGNDIETAEKLLKECFDRGKSGTLNLFQDRTLDDYNRQFIGAVIEGGNRVILVNCFCKSEEKTLKNWKNELVLVADGGNCFFHLKVNIDTGRYYGLMVNGYA
jgi:hypothetical protein